VGCTDSSGGETYGKLPTQLSAFMPRQCPARVYGPTFDVASVKLISHVLELPVIADEGQCAPVERGALA
jgi:hypothetical protein